MYKNNLRYTEVVKMSWDAVSSLYKIKHGLKTNNGRSLWGEWQSEDPI